MLPEHDAHLHPFLFVVSRPGIHSGQFVIGRVYAANVQEWFFVALARKDFVDFLCVHLEVSIFCAPSALADRARFGGTARAQSFPGCGSIDDAISEIVIPAIAFQIRRGAQQRTFQLRGS